MPGTLVRWAFSVVGLAAALAVMALMPSKTALAYPGADNLTIQQQCLPGNLVQAGLSWTTYNLGEQWVDISLTNNNFAPGTFVSNGPHASNVNFVIGPGMQPGVTFFVRVNTLTSTGWYPSVTLQFQTLLNCTNVTIVPLPLQPPTIVTLPPPPPPPPPPPVFIPIPEPSPEPPPQVTPF
jgi:hypothetical protein